MKIESITLTAVLKTIVARCLAIILCVIAFISLIITIVFMYGMPDMYEPFRIPSNSMAPTLLRGDHLIVEKLTYMFSSPSHGDIVIFPFPEDRSKKFIQRIIGLEGDIVEFRDKVFFLNGNMQLEQYAINTDSAIDMPMRDNFGPITIPEGKLFVLGDNRDESYDSRFFGCIPRESVEGKVRILYLSLDTVDHSVRWNRIGNLVK